MSSGLATNTVPDKRLLLPGFYRFSLELHPPLNQIAARAGHHKANCVALILVTFRESDVPMSVNILMYVYVFVCVCNVRMPCYADLAAIIIVSWQTDECCGGLVFVRNAEELLTFVLGCCRHSHRM